MDVTIEFLYSNNVFLLLHWMYQMPHLITNLCKYVLLLFYVDTWNVLWKSNVAKTTINISLPNLSFISSYYEQNSQVISLEKNSVPTFHVKKGINCLTKLYMIWPLRNLVHYLHVLNLSLKICYNFLNLYLLDCRSYNLIVAWSWFNYTFSYM